MFTKASRLRRIHKLLQKGCSAEKLKEFIKKNPESLNIRSSDYFPVTPLLYCSYEGREEHLDVILSFNPDLNAQCEWRKYTALHAAIYRDKLDFARKLIEAGADLMITDYEDRTAVDYALENRLFNLIPAFIEAGFDPNKITKTGKNLLHYAVQSHDIEIFKRVLPLIEDLNMQDFFDDTALHLTAKHEQHEMTKLLLEQGADQTIKNVGEKTAFDCAHSDAVRAALDPNFIPKLTDSERQNDGYVLENQTMVSFTEYAAASDTTFTTFYNFRTSQVITRVKDKGGPSSCIQDFNAVADQTLINEARAFMQKENGMKAFAARQQKSASLIQ